MLSGKERKVTPRHKSKYSADTNIDTPPELSLPMKEYHVVRHSRNKITKYDVFNFEQEPCIINRNAIMEKRLSK